MSVLCDYFAPGGPVDDLTTAAIASARQGRGEEEAPLTRDAIATIEAIAARTTGEEQEDLLTLAEVVGNAALSGEGYVGWSAAEGEFLHKYADPCGYSEVENLLQRLQMCGGRCSPPWGLNRR